MDRLKKDTNRRSAAGTARVGIVVALLLGLVALPQAGCRTSEPAELPPFLCQPCTADMDCGPEENRCLNLPGGGVSCGIDCATAPCPDSFLCAQVEGGGRNCIPKDGVCPDLGPCGGGCSDGWTCDVASNTCVPPGDVGPGDGGTVHTGPWPERDGDIVDLGEMGLFRFVVTGDTRPDHPGGTYPLAIINSIMTQMDALSPDFGVFLGDYLYVSPSNYTIASQQLGFFLSARNHFAPELYYVLGNHEAYNANLDAYRDHLCRAYYYALEGQTPKGSVKMIVIADNRWEANYQKPWVEAQLARPTTYTFVLHHYPSYASTDPSDGDVAATIWRYPITLELAGHFHRYEADGRTATVGNAGAPLSSSRDFFGYLLVELQDDGRVRGTAYRQDTGLPVDSFNVTP